MVEGATEDRFGHGDVISAILDAINDAEGRLCIGGSGGMGSGEVFYPAGTQGEGQEIGQAGILLRCVEVLESDSLMLKAL